MNYNQKYYYENLDKFKEYQYIRNNVNVVKCECCGKSYRPEYMPKHIETNLHKKNKKKSLE